MKKIVLKFAKICLIFLALCFGNFLILDRLFPLNLEMLNKPKSQILLDRNDKIINMKIAKDDIWRFYANLGEIPQNLKQSVLFFEDRYFYSHFGVN